MVMADLPGQEENEHANSSFHLPDGLLLLDSSAIFGANGSGKSNMIKAMKFMRDIILTTEDSQQPEDLIRSESFWLPPFNRQPSFFQMIFLTDGFRYRYGFEIDRGQVVAEWLFTTQAIKETYLFSREQKGIRISQKFPEGQALKDKVKPDQLLISQLAGYYGEISSRVMNWFKRLKIILGEDDWDYRRTTAEMVANSNRKDQIVRLLQTLGLGIEDLICEAEGFDGNTTITKNNDQKSKILGDAFNHRMTMRTIYRAYNAQGHHHTFQSLEIEKESSGTKKLIYLAGPLLDVLQNGKVFVLDDLDALLHPVVTRGLVALFNSRETNPNHTQIIFTTHGSHLLASHLFRRDQIWFCEKDRMGASHLYSLVEIRVKNDIPLEENYLAGRFGGIPFLRVSRMDVTGDEKI
jgi:uncharacterized protein